MGDWEEYTGAGNMDSPIVGLHHVTATVDDAQADVTFYADVLGLRLLKKTVNFDNHHVYHFYYGDEGGTPGTIWTTFPYKGHGVPVGAKGAGQIGVTSFSVPQSSLPFWKDRLRAQAIPVRDVRAAVWRGLDRVPGSLRPGRRAHRQRSRRAQSAHDSRDWTERRRAGPAQRDHESSKSGTDGRVHDERAGFQGRQ